MAEMNLYDGLKNCTTRESVRAEFFARAGISLPSGQKFDSTEQVLYVFRREKTFRPRGVASPLAQALYILRELKYGEAACPIPPYVCAVCRGEAFLAPTKPFSGFYSRRTAEKYDWDRTPLSPCPALVADLSGSPALSRIRVYNLKEPAEQSAFFAALSRARAVQLSMFGREKKTIDENNFLKVYEYWASLFAEYLSGNGEVRRLAEYFLSDIEAEKGGKKRGDIGGTEISFGGKGARKLPAYEYRYFWSLYERVTDERTIFAIRRKIDRLSEDFARRFQGEFYTPIPFAAKAYEYIEKTVGGKNLQSGAYRIWDMAAGSGNLEFTLPDAALPYTYISTLNEDDADYCRRIFPTAEVFQYDYLNDDVEEIFRGQGSGERKNGDGGPAAAEKSEWKMPERLRKDLLDPRLKWLIFINPPFATSNRLSLSAGKASKSGVSDTKLRRVMLAEGEGETGRELFSQFLFRISREFRGRKAYLGLFSTLKYLNAPNDKKLRDRFFRYTAERGFLFSSENFEGSKGKFPVGFIVWNMSREKAVEEQTLLLDVFNGDAEKVGVKRVYTGGRGKPLSEWAARPPTKYVFPPFTGGTKVCEGHIDVRDRVAEGFLCSLMCCGNDFQHQNQTALFSGPQASAGSYSVTSENFGRSMAVHAVRRLPRASWSNNRDQFYCPTEEPDGEFFADCAVWSAFADSNKTCSLESVVYKGEVYRVRNELFPFSKSDAAAWTEGRLGGGEEKESFLCGWLRGRTLSAEAEETLRAARELYAYCFRRGKAELWDVGYVQIKAAVTEDDGGRALLNELKRAHKALGEKLLPRVYAYGFIPEDVRYFEEGE